MSSLKLGSHDDSLVVQLLREVVNQFPALCSMPGPAGVSTEYCVPLLAYVEYILVTPFSYTVRHFVKTVIQNYMIPERRITA